MDIGKDLQDAYECGRQDALNELMEYTYGMLTAEKFGLQHKIKSMMADRCFRKTEPNCSEKPNSCETCKHWWRSEDVCLLDECHYEPKYEPNKVGWKSEIEHRPDGAVWVHHRPDIDDEPQTEVTTDCRQTKMTLDDAYYLVYKDLTKEDGLLTGKYDAKNGSKQYMNGVWSVMELIAYGVGIDCYEAFNERFCRNLEKSQEQTESSTNEGEVQLTDCAWKKGESDDSKRADK